jgi:hypothetical protein
MPGLMGGTRCNDVDLMLRGYGLTTPELFYHMPDHRSVINRFICQDHDLAPDHPGCFVVSNIGRKISMDRCIRCALPIARWQPPVSGAMSGASVPCTEETAPNFTLCPVPIVPSQPEAGPVRQASH